MSEVSESKTRPALNYIGVLKPRESGLHILMGVVAALIAVGDVISAGNAFPTREFILAVFAIACGIPGCNGLTNYLDRNVDARMQRTCLRVLPSQRINPPEKSLPLVIALVVLGLALAWQINWLCFVAGLAGVLAAVMWRKTSLEVFLGIVAGCSPVLVGWFAIEPTLNLKILAICLLVAVWIPLHVWSVMVAYREDYRGAGLNYFPLNWQIKDSVKLLFGLALLLLGVSVFVFFAGEFHLPYLVAAIVLGIVMVSACSRLLVSHESRGAWRVYKLTAFPYAGIIFLTMCLDAWLL